MLTAKVLARRGPGDRVKMAMVRWSDGDGELVTAKKIKRGRR